MAPTIDHVTGSPAPAHMLARSPPADALSPWAIVLIVLAAITLIGLTTLLVLWRLRRKRHDQAPEPWASSLKSISRTSFARKDMSVEDRQKAEELERRAMIQKSLAGRSSARNSQAISESLLENPEADDAQSVRDDWKEWESQLQQQRSNMNSPRSLHAQGHPALSPQPRIASPTSNSRRPARPESWLSNPSVGSRPLIASPRPTSLRIDSSAGHHDELRPCISTPPITSAELAELRSTGRPASWRNDSLSDLHLQGHPALSTTSSPPASPSSIMGFRTVGSEAPPSPRTPTPARTAGQQPRRSTSRSPPSS